VTNGSRVSWLYASTSRQSGGTVAIIHADGANKQRRNAQRLMKTKGNARGRKLWDIPPAIVDIPAAGGPDFSLPFGTAPLNKRS
jgi:hypothetical protein